MTKTLKVKWTDGFLLQNLYSLPAYSCLAPMTLDTHMFFIRYTGQNVDSPCDNEYNLVYQRALPQNLLPNPFQVDWASTPPLEVELRYTYDYFLDGVGGFRVGYIYLDLSLLRTSINCIEYDLDIQPMTLISDKDNTSGFAMGNIYSTVIPYECGSPPCDCCFCCFE